MNLKTQPYRIPPRKIVSLRDHDPADTQGLERSKRLKRQFRNNVKRLKDYQARLYAEGRRSLLVVLQGMDTSGKDSTIRSVFGDLNPQGVRVTSFKVPSQKELDHDFLWRIHQNAPRRGYIGVFNRSHYEDVLVVRVRDLAPKALVEKRYRHINEFERILNDHGTRVVKLMLHISKDYQLTRLRRRLERPDKWWKFNPADLKERQVWDQYIAAYQEALSRCSTRSAPWFVIPSENRWFRNLLISRILLDLFKSMDPRYPKSDFDPAQYPPDSIQ